MQQTQPKQGFNLSRWALEHAALTRYLVAGLHGIEGVTVWGDHDAPDGALGLVAFLPEIFNEIVSGGYLDGTEVSETFSWANKAMVLFTFIVLKIKQAPTPSKPLFPNE